MRCWGTAEEEQEDLGSAARGAYVQGMSLFACQEMVTRYVRYETYRDR